MLSRFVVLAMAVVLATVAVPRSTQAQNHGAPFAAAGKDRHPLGEGPVRTNRDLDCSNPVQTVEITTVLFQTFTDTTSGTSTVGSYACRPDLEETGPEHIYELTAATDLTLDAWLQGGGPDHDLILLSHCHPDSCIVQGNSQISATLTQGQTYYLVVDGYLEAEGEYNLTLEGRHLGIPEEICAPDGVSQTVDPIELQIYDTDDIIVPGGEFDLFGTVNRVSIYDCSLITVPGGEQWFEVAIVAADTAVTDGDWASGEYPWNRHQNLEFTVSTAEIGLDLTLWIFDGCGPDAECLAFVDNNAGGGQESINLENLDLNDQTLYMAVDCIRPVDAAGEGIFILDITASTPVETRSLSSMRDLFR